MKVAPMFAGAAVVAACAGTAIGLTLPTKPIAMGGDPLAEIPKHPVSQAAFEPQRRGPDHYPLQTPEGTIEVHELADHGLYRNRRYLDARYDYAGASDPADDAGYSAAHDFEMPDDTPASLPVVIVPGEAQAIDTATADAAPLQEEPVERTAAVLKAEPRMARLDCAGALRN
ncbi:hypothetical protein [Altererythrobacter sp. MF3-039]|uniref:hypothetical protein n=1 Tax=Altererythrobacter sp. MF3-039 TaxID=3252901 RepID=UPI00390C8331